MAVRSMTIVPITHRSSQNSCAADKPMHAKKPTAQIIATVFGIMLSAPKNIVATVQKKKNNILNINHILYPFVMVMGQSNIDCPMCQVLICLCL